MGFKRRLWGFCYHPFISSLNVLKRLWVSGYSFLSFFKTKQFPTFSPNIYCIYIYSKTRFPTRHPILLPLGDHHQAHHSQHEHLQPRMLTEQDRNIAHIGDVSDHGPNDLSLPIEVVLVAGIEIDIVGWVIVAFRQEGDLWPVFFCFVCKKTIIIIIIIIFFFFFKI